MSVIENAFLALGFPQAPDDLKSGVGLADARGHDEKYAILAFGDGLDSLINRDALVVTRLFPACVVVKVLKDHFFLRRLQIFPRAVLLPELLRRGEGPEWYLGFRLPALPGSVVEQPFDEKTKGMSRVAA